MQKQILSLVTALILSSSLSACSGSAQVNVPNPIPGIQGYIQSLRTAEQPASAATTTKANLTVQQQAATDLVPYRCQFDQTVNAWIVFYYSPSKQKSYECRPKADKTVVVTEVTDVTMTYKEGDTLQTEKVTVDAATACQTAANETAKTPPATGTTTEVGATTPAGSTTTTTTTTNTTNVTINNVYLITAGELKKKHNRNSSNPAYVVVTNNQNVYVDASTGKTITATDGGAVNTGSGTATGGTSTTTTTTTTGG